jgi:uracil-DNA glycosylase
MFTDELIQTISIEHPNLIFVLWGSNALSKMNIIKNKDNHHFLISSHPSPLSVNNKLKSFESFYNSNHFGTINDILSTHNKYIDWQI